jgi:Zinc finger C-x8-C-x5-C-x3-H type (and similar)
LAEQLCTAWQGQYEDQGKTEQEKKDEKKPEVKRAASINSNASAAKRVHVAPARQLPPKSKQPEAPAVDIFQSLKSQSLPKIKKVDKETLKRRHSDTESSISSQKITDSSQRLTESYLFADCRPSPVDNVMYAEPQTMLLSPTVPAPSYRKEVKESQSEDTSSDTKPRTKKKSVTWKPEIKTIRYFDVDEITEVIRNLTQHKKINPREFERDEMKNAKQMARDEMNAEIAWTAPLPIKLETRKFGVQSHEVDVQKNREATTVSIAYFRLADIPPSPAEPPSDGLVHNDDAPLIPLVDVNTIPAGLAALNANPAPGQNSMISLLNQLSAGAPAPRVQSYQSPVSVPQIGVPNQQALDLLQNLLTAAKGGVAVLNTQYAAPAPAYGAPGANFPAPGPNFPSPGQNYGKGPGPSFSGPNYAPPASNYSAPAPNYSVPQPNFPTYPPQQQQGYGNQYNNPMPNNPHYGNQQYQQQQQGNQQYPPQEQQYPRNNYAQPRPYQPAGQYGGAPRPEIQREYRQDNRHNPMGRPPTRASNPLYKTKQCHNFNKGSCPYGDNCKYAHGVADLK